MDKSKNTKTMPESLVASVSSCTDKLIFFYDVFKNKRHIETQIFNDVFCEYEEKFHKNNKYKTAMADFKKWLKVATENRAHRIVTHNATQNHIVHGLRSTWSVVYSY